jgi:SAM-dependent methyltransferase
LLRTLLHKIVARPLIYDWVQRLAGFEKTLSRLRPLFTGLSGQVVLDVGAGTGNYLQIMPSDIRYIWLDNDTEKLQGFKAKGRPALTLIGDATRIALQDGSVDVGFCCALSHHLSEKEISALFQELARVCRKKLIFLDAVYTPRSIASRLLWRYDRGSYPRSPQVLSELMTRSFNVVYKEEYTIHHSYVLWVGEPKRPPS